MNRMFPPPMIIGREGKQASDEAHDIIGRARLEKGAMAAVVKNDEHAHENPPRQDGQHQRQPIGDRKAAVHQVPKECVRAEGVNNLPERPPQGGLLVFEHQLLPSGRFSLIPDPRRC